MPLGTEPNAFSLSCREGEKRFPKEPRLETSGMNLNICLGLNITFLMKSTDFAE